MAENKQKLVFVNIAKGIAICAVVLLHLRFQCVDGIFPLRSLLGDSWHVAVFFIIGGFFIKNDKLLQPKSFIKKKMLTLYKMLIFYYIPAVLLHNYLINIGWYSTQIDYHGKVMRNYNIVDTISHIIQSICFAGREPILGAMWFVYVLLLAFIGYTFVSCIIYKITKGNELRYEIYRAIVLFVLCAISSTLSEEFGIMIPRCSNTITAMWLIHLGYILKNIIKCKFDNKYIALISIIIVYHIAVNVGAVSLNVNKYQDATMLTISSVSALYFICWFSRKIENKSVGKFLNKCGEESFHIMALHLVGFKLGIELLNMCGANIMIASQMPLLGKNYLFVIILFLFGVLFPICFIWVFRTIKIKIISLYRYIKH